MARTSLTVALISFTMMAAAYNISHTSCSLEHANFVTAPNVRGTLDILWTCILTLIICVYQVLHLEVPQVPLNGWRSIRRSAYWTFIAILAPEFILADAMSCFVEAVSARRTLDVPHRERLSLTHLAFARMGGFVIRCKRSDVIDHTEDAPASPSDALEGVCVTTAFLCFAVKAGRVGKSLPNKAGIVDKSKGDLFTTILSVAQLLYFLLQVIVRKVNRLPLSQFEVGTTAFAGMAAVTYLLYFPRPKAVALQHEITLERALSDAERKELRLRNNANNSALELFGHSKVWLDTAEVGGVKDTPPSIIFLELPILGSLFSAINFAAWNLEFPSNADLQCWRAATVASTCILPLCFGYFVMNEFCLHHGDAGFNVVLALSTLLYLAARVILVVEMFRTLFFLPPEAFQATWTTSIPHIG